MRRFFFLSVCLFFSCVLCLRAQDWYQVHVDYDGHEWLFPVNFQHVSFMDFNEDNSAVKMHLADDENIVIPFNVEASSKWDAVSNGITLSDELSQWGKNKHKVFAIYITTDDGSDIDSKEVYKHCYISVDGMGEYPDNSVEEVTPHGNGTRRNLTESNSTRRQKCWESARTRTGFYLPTTVTSRR